MTRFGTGIAFTGCLAISTALLQGIYNQLIFLDAPEFQDTNLAQAPQFKPIFAGARTEKEALKRAIDDLKQRIDPLAAAEKRAREEVEDEFFSYTLEHLFAITF